MTFCSQLIDSTSQTFDLHDTVAHALEMMDFIIAELRLCHVNRILLEVGVDNDSAIRFYTRIGFKEISRRKDYYRSGEDAFVMELNL